MTWTSLCQLEEALFHYFESVIIFYQSVEQQYSHPNMAPQLPPISIALKPIIKIQAHLFQMSNRYLLKFEHLNLEDEYVQYCRSFIKLNERLDELWKSVCTSPILQTETSLQFKQFRYYFIKKRKLLQSYGQWD
ncbi:MAG: hypothetical protein P0Y55_07330 [Candidatus Cohnella colombiensis]|uniref:Uncharacterized protein n=1 Tax=Candidatus Cohnella colombiensis TaxID=3121368 RepID=A0AA95F2W0_9BACL|nr:MAG: hypothetical protein P0Y55_07330 [Cohnella sp.]